MIKVAIFVPGGVEDLDSIRSIPPLVIFLKGISNHYDVTVYSFSRIDPRFCSNLKYRVKYVPYHHNVSLYYRFFILTILFLKDHLQMKYRLLHGIWGFPAGFFAVLFGKLLNLPTIVSLQGGETANLPGIGYGNMAFLALRKATLWTCRNAHRITVLTNFQYKELQKYTSQLKEVSVIPFGVNLNLFRLKSKIVKPSIRFIHVGSLNLVKDQITLLRSFAIISKQVSCQLRIIGQDFLNGKLQKMAFNLGIGEKVNFLDRLTYQGLPQHYEWAHILLHTSLYEGQGVVIAEAAASGVVICGTRVGLIEDLGEECCVSVDVGDYEGLAERILRLLNNTQQIEELRKNAYSWAKVHDANWTIDQFDRIYSDCLVE